MPRRGGTSRRERGRDTAVALSLVVTTVEEGYTIERKDQRRRIRCSSAKAKMAKTARRTKRDLLMLSISSKTTNKREEIISKGRWAFFIHR